MLVCALVSCGLLYVLARRVQIGRPFAAVAVVAFAFSPLSLQYQRLAFLDNLAVMWLLGALVFAASPRRSLAAAFGCGCCFSASVLTKETTVLLLPVVWMVLRRHTTERTRTWSLGVFTASFLGIVAVYPLYALLKHELFQGAGHVSLLGSIKWQLLARPASGSLLDRSSDTYNLARSWIDADPWLLLVGVALIPLGLVVRRLRAIALALFIQVAMMVRNGYMPYAYVTAMLPFAALLIGGLADVGWKLRPTHVLRWRPARAVPRHTLRLGATVVTVGLLGGVAVSAAPRWYDSARVATTADDRSAYLAATQWVIANLDRDNVILVDDYMWTDLARAGFRNEVWYNKAVLDPTVQATYFPHGYADADYVILGHMNASDLAAMPLIADAMVNSTVVHDFGPITVRKVTKPTEADSSFGTPVLRAAWRSVSRASARVRLTYDPGQLERS